MMNRSALVEASARAATSGSRLAKRDALAACLRATAPDEIAIAVAFLCGERRTAGGVHTSSVAQKLP